MACIDAPAATRSTIWGVWQTASAVALSVAALAALAGLHAAVEPLSWASAILASLITTITVQRWRVRATRVIASICIAIGLGQPFGAWVADLWLGLMVGAGAAAGVYALAMSIGRGRWQAGLLAQTALIGVGLQMGYRQRAPVDLIHIANADKALHALLIGAIAFWANLVLEGRAWRTGRVAVPVAIIVPLMLAAAEEWAQGLTPWRHRDGLDLLADAIGLGLFWMLSELVRRRRTRPLEQGG